MNYSPEEKRQKVVMNWRTFEKGWGSNIGEVFIK